MAATREDVIAAINADRDEIERVVSSAGEDGWSKPAYEGWTAKQLLCHIASTSGPAGFLLMMARNPGATFGGGMDQDEMNAEQVALRESKPIGELLAEATGHLKQDVESVSAAPEELLDQHYTAPWGSEGRLADVMVESLRDHLMVHVRDLEAALK